MLRFLKYTEFFLGFLAIPIILAFFNYRLIWPQFQGEFTQHLASIEVSYISMAKFILDSWPHITWQPFWYFGFPQNVFYTPLLPFLEILGKILFGWSYSQAYRVFTSLSYILAPVSLYFFTWYLTSRKIGGLTAALAYSFLPSLLALIFPEIRADFLAADLEPRRYTILVRWGEGPHTVALVFIPLAAAAFLWALRSNKFTAHVLASVFIVLVALTNAIALWAVALLCLSLALGELVRGVKFGNVAKNVVLVAAISAGLSAFWYNPQFISTFFREGSGTVVSLGTLGPWGLIGAVFGLLILFFAGKLLLKKIINFFPGAPHSFFWFLFMFAIVFVYYVSGESRVELVPQALRLNTEADMGAAIVLGVVVSGVASLPFRFNFSTRIGSSRASGRSPLADFGGKFSQILSWSFYFIAAAGILIPMFFRSLELAKAMPKWTQSLEATGRKLEDTAEYRVAKWAEAATPEGTRVAVPGNYGFFLNYFVNVPQLRGALYQSSTHFWPDHIYFQLTNGKDADISLAWLKISNISNLVYTTGASSEIYKDYKVPPEKFDSVLTRTYEEKGDIFYQVPLKNPIPAKLVDLAKIKTLKKPFNAIDEEPIFSYLAWIEEQNDKRLNFQKVNNDKYLISGSVGQGEGILVQMSYDPGWIAECKLKGESLRPELRPRGCKVKVRKDPLGFILIEPKSGGEQQIILQHGISWQVWFGWMITAFTVGYLIWQLFKHKTENAERKT